MCGSGSVPVELLATCTYTMMVCVVALGRPWPRGEASVKIIFRKWDVGGGRGGGLDGVGSG